MNKSEPLKEGLVKSNIKKTKRGRQAPPPPAPKPYKNNNEKY